MKRIAYLTGRAWRLKPMPPGELPPLEQPDHKLLVAAGREQGLSFEIRYWDDPALPHDGYDAAIIRSCWDYIERWEEFAATIATHERAGLKVFNRADVVRWNVRKTYLRELGAAAIDTLWSDALDARAVAQAFDAFDASELVIKPQVGGGSRETLRLKRNSWSEADLHAGPSGPAMLQPYMKSIESEGERSLFWFGGVFSHAIRKVPEEGGWLANRPGATRFFEEAPPPDAREAAESARAHAPRDLLYVRIDLVQADAGDWRVIEIEAIEPYLFFNFARAGAPAFAAALSRVLAG